MRLKVNYSITFQWTCVADSDRQMTVTFNNAGRARLQLRICWAR
jgi:hypothetical protein